MPAPRTGMVGVRLADVPLSIRRRYGGALKAVLMREGEGGDLYALMLSAARMEAAIEEPSEQVYYVPRTAYEKVSARWPRA